MASVYAVRRVILNCRPVFEHLIVPVRHIGYRSRWKAYYERLLPTPVYEQRKKNYREKVMMALEEMPNLKQKLQELNSKDPLYDAKIDIGLPSSCSKLRISAKERFQWTKELKLNKDIEKQALDKVLKVDIDEMHKEWQISSGPEQIKNVAEHYGVFDHLFHHGFFFPRIPLDICYDFEEESVTPVYMGNILEASEAGTVPHVNINCKDDDLWTLVLTNLDGHLLDCNSEYVHWLIGNIKGNNVKNGEIIYDYMRPFPMRGTGYHRLVFVLYKQNKHMDYSFLRKASPCVDLKERTFRTFDFYKKHQEDLTPAGLAFFQCIWDTNTTAFFHDVLKMREPVFEYPDKVIEPIEQVQYPHRMPFNIYLDRYRDPKEIKKEVLLKRLKMVHPFKEEEPMPKHPCLHKPTTVPPSWLKDDFKNERLRLGKYRDLRPASVYPQEDNQGEYYYKA